MQKVYKQPDTAAWRKGLGDIDWNRAVNKFAPEYKDIDMTAVGITLGGFGAGNFMYNLAGTFGPWHMKPGMCERRFLDSAAFHVRERMGETEPIVKTLAAEKKFTNSKNDLLAGWRDGLLPVGSADYHALYPIGWVDYKETFKAQLGLEFFSPIIRDNYRETSLPLAYFNFSASNPTNEPIELSIMFTFPNMPIYSQNERSIIKAIVSDPSLEGIASSEIIRRKGLKNRAVREKGYAGVAMISDSPENRSDVQRSEICIATAKSEDIKVECCAAWDADSDGCDILEAFRKGNLEEDSGGYELPAGAVAVNFTLMPDETRTVPFALTWDFPIIQLGETGSDNCQLWWKKYTEYYPPCKSGKWVINNLEPQAWDMACDALRDVEKNHAAVHGWMEEYLNEPKYKGKEWILTAGFNELFCNAFGGSFWENGLIDAKYVSNRGEKKHSSKKPFGNRDFSKNPLYKDVVANYKVKKQSLHFTMEAPEFPFAETFDVRAHSHRVYTDLWPEIERDILLCYRDFIMDTDDGSCPHDAGSTLGGAYLRYDHYLILVQAFNPDYRQYAEKRLTTPWSEYSPKFILYSYEYWEKTHDSAFLDDILVAIIRSYIYQRRTDTDNDGITNMMSSEYKNNDLFNSVLWIAALEALLRICKERPEWGKTVISYTVENNDGEIVASITDELVLDAANELARVRAYVENNLWNKDNGYYKYNFATPSLMADAFIGESMAQSANLGCSVDERRLAQHFKTLHKYNVGENYDRNGDGFGDCGAKNLYHFKSGNHNTADGIVSHDDDVWTGVSYVLSGTMYAHGKRVGDTELMDAALSTGYGVYYTTYIDEKFAYYFNTPEAWDALNPHISRNYVYQRARGIWNLLRSM